MSAISLLALLVCWWLPPLVLALALAVSGRAIAWRWFVAAMAAYGLYALAGYWTLPVDVDALPPEARWLSRLAQLATGSALVAVLWRRDPQLTADRLGLTLRQAPGSLPWSLAGLAALVSLGLLPGGMEGASAAPPGATGWLYHLTLPGIEEELMYRGLLLSLFAAAIGGARVWAALMATLVFALAHGVTPGAHGIGVNYVMLGYTLVVGAILAAMRLRSGSLLLPILGHNLIGLAMRLG
jgi:hypothetical protein